MRNVRNAELNQKLGIPANENKDLSKSKVSTPEIKELELVEELAIEEPEEAIREEDVASPEVVYEIESEVYDLKTVEHIAQEFEKDEILQEITIQPQIKRSRASPGLPESIVYTRYELVASDENDPSVVILNVTAQLLNRPSEGNYEFDCAWIAQLIDSATVYKCQHCVKAFSNADFLLKHTLSSHLCLICLEIVENYKELNKHSKTHSTINCHFCNKDCGSTSIFRQHLKKNHMLQIPNYVGILKAK